MKKLIYLLVAGFLIASCAESKTVTVTVTNSTSSDRMNEKVEVAMNEVASKLKMADKAQIVVIDTDEKQEQ